MKVRDLVKAAQEEIVAEDKAEAKSIIKERLREIRMMRKALDVAEDQFEDMLKQDVSDVIL